MRVDVSTALSALVQRPVNYEIDEVDGSTWHVDRRHVWLPSEPPGPPEHGGVWQRACRLVADYEFSPPELVRAVYDPGAPLLERTMLLEGRFPGLRLYLGVRVTEVTDEQREPDRRVWGFSYDTLRGHLERGRLSYEVVKHTDTGHVEFGIAAYSQRAPTLGPLMRTGWAVFGRGRQVRFYRRCGRRMQELTRAKRPRRPMSYGSSGLVLAPSDARSSRLDRMAFTSVDPS